MAAPAPAERPALAPAADDGASRGRYSRADVTTPVSAGGPVAERGGSSTRVTGPPPRAAVEPSTPNGAAARSGSWGDAPSPARGLVRDPEGREYAGDGLGRQRVGQHCHRDVQVHHQFPPPPGREGRRNPLQDAGQRHLLPDVLRLEQRDADARHGAAAEGDQCLDEAVPAGAPRARSKVAMTESIRSVTTAGG